MEPDREAVGLVTDPLEQLQSRRARVEHYRVGAAGNEYFLRPLGERDHGYAREVELVHGRECGGELTLATVDDHEVGYGGEALVVVRGRGGGTGAREAPRHHLPHH